MVARAPRVPSGSCCGDIFAALRTVLKTPDIHPMNKPHDIILIADPLAKPALALLEKTPRVEIKNCAAPGGPRFDDHIASAAAVIVRSETRITREVLARAPKLKVVGRAGVGVDNIDIDAATERGVMVMNTPGGNSIAAAELAFTHLLLTARPVAAAASSMREGRWDRKNFSGIELHGKTLAVFGCGKIGALVAERARAFAMRVIAYDPFLSDARAKSLGVERVEADAALAAADFITLHLPSTDETRGFFNRERFARLKPGCRLVNCARGDIVVESDLLAALDSGQLAAAALDVFEHEPLAADSPLRTHPAVVLTPHLGASTREAQDNVGLQIVESVLAAVRGGTVRNALNMPSVDERSLLEIGAHLALAESLAKCVQILCPDTPATLRVGYFGRLAEIDTSLVTRAAQKGFLLRIAGREVNWVNAPAKLKALGIGFESTQHADDSEFAELIRVEAFDAAGRPLARLDGTLVGAGRKPRFVAWDGRDMEIAPVGWLLFFRHDDRPGMVGAIGTALGGHGVNIAAMALSPGDTDGAPAMAILAIDVAPTPALLATLAALPGVRRVVPAHCG